MSQYSATALTAPSGTGTIESSAEGKHSTAAVDDNQFSVDNATVTPQAQAAEPVPSREEKVEYRDQDGNTLNEEQVRLLEGRVSFSTKYETRTRVLNSAGDEMADDTPGAEGFAPAHPDMEREPETKTSGLGIGDIDAPVSVSPVDYPEKERYSNEAAKSGQPRPASEAYEATK